MALHLYLNNNLLIMQDYVHRTTTSQGRTQYFKRIRFRISRYHHIIATKALLIKVFILKWNSSQLRNLSANVYKCISLEIYSFFVCSVLCPVVEKDSFILYCVSAMFCVLT